MEYFDLGKAYLTQSGQLYGRKRPMALGKVYSFGPTFRGRNAKKPDGILLNSGWLRLKMHFYDLNDDMILPKNF